MSKLIEALDHAAAGDWEAAHSIVQEDGSRDAAWIHAHLHRVEGDLPNARYWYSRAGRPESSDSLEAERARIREALTAEK